MLQGLDLMLVPRISSPFVLDSAMPLLCQKTHHSKIKERGEEFLKFQSKWTQVHLPDWWRSLPEYQGLCELWRNWGSKKEWELQQSAKAGRLSPLWLSLHISLSEAHAQQEGQPLPSLWPLSVGSQWVYCAT